MKLPVLKSLGPGLLPVLRVASVFRRVVANVAGSCDLERSSTNKGEATTELFQREGWGAAFWVASEPYFCSFAAVWEEWAAACEAEFGSRLDVYVGVISLSVLEVRAGPTSEW